MPETSGFSEAGMCRFAAARRICRAGIARTIPVATGFSTGMQRPGVYYVSSSVLYGKVNGCFSGGCRWPVCRQEPPVRQVSFFLSCVRIRKARTLHDPRKGRPARGNTGPGNGQVDFRQSNITCHFSSAAARKHIRICSSVFFSVKSGGRLSKEKNALSDVS